MVYEAADGQVVLFGGGFHRLLGDTWTWNGTDWTEQHPAHAPAPRRAMSMAYDEADGRTVLFGGETGSDPFFPRDTWTWDGTDWTEQHPAHAPGGRWFQGSAYDAATNRVLMFGGLDSGGDALNETWAWDGTDWSLLTPAHSPSPRSDLAMVEDSTHGYDLLYGGDSRAGALGDTWSWDGTDWRQLSPLKSPIPLNDAGIVDDPAAGQVVVFGGGESGGPRRPNSTTWTWDGTTWSKHGSGWISVSPGSGPPGTIVRVTGWSFDPAGPVKLRFVDSAGGRFLGVFEADIDGRFSGTVKIPGDAIPGKQFIHAIEQQRICVTKRAFTVT
jgi:hypothetical protein